MSIALTRQRKDGIGAALNSASNHPGEVNAKKGIFRIRNRINEISAKLLCFRT
jgi:hypothetical protein